MKRIILSCLACCLVTTAVSAQGLTDMSHSRRAQVYNLPMGATRWTGGFWGERFSVLATTGVWSMWDTWNTPYETVDALGLHGSHGFANFQVAAGTVKGKHHGPPFHDGDMYKWLEACAAVYAVTHDPRLDSLMDRFIEQVALAQRADGYIHTPVIIADRNAQTDQRQHNAQSENAAGIEIGKDQKHAFASRLNFETYNLGHLMTAGIIHKRATGKTTLFECGKKAADFLYGFLTSDAAELSRNAICPSHYMGAAEMYRETGDERYLTLAKGLIAIRDSVTNGEDHNQDRHKFRDQYEAMGHAVRANYLYAGVADLYAETGEAQLMKNLSAIWDDIVNRKIYIMGGCGALYDGVSPDGTTYNQPAIQQIHQAYGRQYQLPQEAAHNEICAQIGMLLFSWRMFQTTCDPKYIDNIENELYNGILSGISLDGRDFFYTEALRRPPNTLRTLCQAQEYAYAVRGDTLWVNLYGQNTLKTAGLEIEQTTGYPWDGHIRLTVRKARTLRSIRMHIPGWATDMQLRLNGQPILAEDLRQPRPWKKGDGVELDLPMRPRLFQETKITMAGHEMIALEADVPLVTRDAWAGGELYRELRPVRGRRVHVRLIPYYAWDNRGIQDMSLWLPLYAPLAH